MSEERSLFFVTGLSGAGISSTLKVLEDLNCEVFDNVPINLVQQLIAEHTSSRSMAFGMDTRTRNFDPNSILRFIKNLKNTKPNVFSIFITADDSILLRRFTETRRTHPLARNNAVMDGILAEKSLLEPLKLEADILIDTSEYTIHDLRRQIEGHIQGIASHKINISVTSFAFRNGLPREADLVFDVRFLRNPNWVSELKLLTGRDQAVQDYIQNDESFSAFENHIKNLLELLIPKYSLEGKNYLTIAFGCTGGRHRSVFLVEHFTKWLTDNSYPARSYHREIKI